jgi:adenylylsulfate kinase-like enzyme
MIPSEPPRALLITGTVGSGKTSTADALGDLLTGAGVRNAVIDLDWLCRSWPTPPGDPFNFAMTLRNLRDVARNYLEAGASRLVLAGVVESRAERRRYEETVGAELTVCRIRVALPTVHRRLARRHEGDDADLRWHVERSGELDPILEAAKVEDVVVEAADRPVTAVAAAVLDAVGWR